MILLSLAILLGLMALTIPVVAVLGIIGLTLDQVYSMVPLVYGIGDVAWKASTDFILVAIPLYLLLGQLLLRSGIAERMYAALSQWFSWMPGLLLTTAFVLIVLTICIIRPSLGGRRVETDWRRRIQLLPDLLPPIILFVLVVGSIYAGLATPTESAALGVVGAVVLAAARKRLSIAIMVEAFEGTLLTTGLMMIIVVSAYFLNFVFSFVGLPSHVNSLITSLDLSPYGVLAVVIVFYLVLGMFMETLSMMVATVPIITPVIVAAGFDPVWFGVMMILLIETALITPPVGFNLFIIQGVRGRGQVHDIMIGAFPFVVALLIMLLLIATFPQIALWLPQTLWG